MSKITRNYIPEMLALGFWKRRPRMVTVNLTNHCNQQCIYCEIGMSVPSLAEGDLSFEDLIWILHQMKANNIRKISLCGGEPFLFPRLIDLIRYAGELKIRSSVTTNGMTAHLLSPADLDILVKYGTEVNLSVDSFDEETNNRIRGNSGALRNAMKSFRHLEDNGVLVTVLTVISRFNHRNLAEFFQQAWKSGIRQVLFQPVISFSNYPDRHVLKDKSNYNVPPEEVDALMSELHKILRFERMHRIRSNTYRILPWIRSYLMTSAGAGDHWFFNGVLKKFYCREVDAIIDISYNGSIQPCALSVARVNIHERKDTDLVSLWKNATQDLRNRLERSDFPAVCNGCCNHFSRNMMASVIRYPFLNRITLIRLASLIIGRAFSLSVKKLILVKL